MTPANATSCVEMVNEIRLLVADQPRSEQCEMLSVLKTVLGSMIRSIEEEPDPDPDELALNRKLSAADDRRDFEKGKQP